MVPTDTPGFAAHKITHKMSLRASVTSELTFENLRLPADAVFPDVTGLKGPLACLSEARSDILCAMVLDEKPALSVGTMNPRMPSSLWAHTIAMSAIEPFVIHILRPSSTQSSPSRRARVRIEPGSDP